MSLALALACLLISVSAILACATPREAPTREPEPQSARHSPPQYYDKEPQTESSELVRSDDRKLKNGPASESFRMSGSGDAEAVHDLKVGTYHCGITLQNNVARERPEPFRVQFLSRDPIGAPLVSLTQASLNTSTQFILIGRAQAAAGQVEVKLRAAPLGQWTLQCDRSGDVFQSSTGYVNLGGFITVTGSGTDRFPMRVRGGRYDCQMRVTGNYAEDGRAAQFAIEVDGRVETDIEASDWEGEFEYVAEAGSGARTIWIDVTAAKRADWRVSCAPPLG